MQPALPSPSEYRLRLIVVPTRTLIGWFRERMAQARQAQYDLNEIGHAFVESWQRMDLEDPVDHSRQRQAFAEHFARAHADEDERRWAEEIYDELFDALCAELESTLTSVLRPQVGFHVFFHQWLGDDLVVLLQPHGAQS